MKTKPKPFTQERFPVQGDALFFSQKGESQCTNNNNHTNSNTTNDLSFDEAPASWNTRYVDLNGFECQITLRGESGSELLEQANCAIAYLLKNGCIP